MPRRLFAATLLAFVWFFFALTPIAFAQAERHFEFHYGFTVKNIPAGQRVRIWIPLAHSDSFQDVQVTAKSGDLPLKQFHESEYALLTEVSEAS